ncbi:MAG: PQQ-like beta-propeller repeat protein [Bryobacterales bacterium]|nr:PQQ-like beta-propeller repeat protein [Bryobacterales bacterium]
MLFAAAGSWPQFGGPGRDFLVPGKVEGKPWPAGGPRVLWERPLGDGYASFVTSGGPLYTMYRRGSDDVVIALDPASGKTIWETPLAAAHGPGMNVEAGPGPHSTPLLANGRLFVTTVMGRLAALDVKTGKVLWSQELWTKHNGNKLERGYASSPLAYKDTVIVPVGGNGRALMAFRQSDGSPAWSAGDGRNSYSSPISVRDQIVIFLAKEVIGIDPATRATRWRIPHQTQFDIHAATPTWCEAEGVLVISSGYDGGARGIAITADGARELWAHKRLRVHHGNMACREGVVYGSSGDFGPAPFTAIDAKTGKVLWQDRAFSKANFILADDQAFVTDDDGSVAVAQVSREGLKVISEAQLLKANSWTVPMVHNGRLFVRDRHKALAIGL